MYTNEEYCEMVLLYKREVARLYAMKFPSERHPSYCTIARAIQRLYKTRNCHRRIPLSRDTPSSLRIPSEHVLGYVLAHPESSVRLVGLFLLKINGREHITYVRCLSLSSRPGAGTNIRRTGASFWFLQFRVKHTG
ncbi:uncharacterized protein TNCV_3308571 [Trichonephila clavipes]|nr:uncharacterized protein TNCV_3308571 [Trichonephila clavipes]